MTRDHFEENAVPHTGHTREFPLLSAISQQALSEFCAALEFAVHNDAITEGELQTLRKTLLRIAREAHASHMLPEQLLIGLRQAWLRVCGRTPGPDMYDASWHLVVDECLAAYEVARP